MRIANTLRKEAMPEMVYVMCKLARYKEYHKQELINLVTLENLHNQTARDVYSFCIDCGFLTESGDEEVLTPFDEADLEDFSRFRYKVAANVFQGRGTLFTSVTKWFLEQDRSVFKYRTANDLASVLPLDSNQVNITEYTLGFRNWMEGLGLATVASTGSSGALVFAVHRLLKDWLTYAVPFRRNEPVMATEFFRKLNEDLPQFAGVAKENQVKESLSMGLRVLHNLGVIEIVYTHDSSDIWHLTQSVQYDNTRVLSEIIVR